MGHTSHKHGAGGWLLVHRTGGVFHGIGYHPMPLWVSGGSQGHCLYGIHSAKLCEPIHAQRSNLSDTD